MKGGMNFSASVVLHALSNMDISAPKFRLQVDGASDNVNYAMFSLAGILLLAGIFEQVHLVRMPVGLVLPFS